MAIGKVTIPIYPFLAASAPTVVPQPVLPLNPSTGVIQPPIDGAFSSLQQIVTDSGPSNIVTFQVQDGPPGGPYFGPTYQLLGTGLASLVPGNVGCSIGGTGTQQDVANAISAGINSQTGLLFGPDTYGVSSTVAQVTGNWRAQPSSPTGSLYLISPSFTNISLPTWTISGFTAGPLQGIPRGYKLVAEDALGRFSSASAETIAQGYTTLDSSHVMHITWTDPTGIVKMHIFRSTGAITDALGYIGVVNAGVQVLNDTGLVGDGSTAPVVNNTGFSTPVDVSGFDKVTVYVSAFTGTWHVEISPDAGVTWYRASTDTSGAGFADVETLTEQLRVVLTAETGVAPTAYLLGDTDDIALTGQTFYDKVTDAFGNGIPYVTVNVYLAGTATLVANVETDFAGNYSIPLTGELVGAVLVDVQYLGGGIQTFTKQSIRLL